MPRLTTTIFVCISVVIVSYLTIDCKAYSIQVDDLEVAASDKHQQWEKGDESDHHASEHGESGKKGENGYDVQHGYVPFFSDHFHSLLIRNVSFGRVLSLSLRKSSNLVEYYYLNAKK